MQLQDQGRTKYGAHDILACSKEAGWRALAVEHRHHPRGVITSFEPQNLEICIATDCHRDCAVSRTGDRVRQHTPVEPGTIWFCPAGVLEEDIEIKEWHDILHVFVPARRFTELSDACGGAAVRADGVPYLGGIYHERMRRIGDRLLGHLEAPHAAASVLVDTLAIELTACVVSTYSNTASTASSTDAEHRLDTRRLRRVIDYMTAHLDEDIGLDDLANAACFSAFHFSRVFANTVGVPPYRYLSRLRLERAKTLLTLGATPISQIALLSCFSSQSSFTRAFRRATGFTPQGYRFEKD